jgi:hypothetical protein
VLGAVNAGLTAIVDLGLAPAIRIAPLATLFVISVLTGAAMLWVIGRTSNQAGIARAKRGIQAALFEVRLFNDNLGAVLRALGSVLAHNARYLGYSLVPLAWAALPLILVIAQLQAFYGYDGITAGAAALVTATLRDPSAAAAASTASLVAPAEIRVETGAVVLPGAGEVIWRIVPSLPGAFTVRATIAGHELTKTVQVGGAAARRSPFRVSGLFDQLLYPSEPVLTRETSLTRIAVPYSEPGIEVLGWRVHWMIVYVAVSMAAAFALAKRMGVTL